MASPIGHASHHSVVVDSSSLAVVVVVAVKTALDVELSLTENGQYQSSYLGTNLGAVPMHTCMQGG
jgi:hypothetical protein